MHKTLLILLFPLVVFSTTGVSLTSLYCQGKFSQIGFHVHPCCNDVNKGGCCETKSVLLKNPDSFFEKRKEISAKLFSPEKALVYLPLSDWLRTYRTDPRINQPYKNTYLPPQYAYVLFCTFLLWYHIIICFFFLAGQLLYLVVSAERQLRDSNDPFQR